MGCTASFTSNDLNELNTLELLKSKYSVNTDRYARIMKKITAGDSVSLEQLEKSFHQRMHGKGEKIAKFVKEVSGNHMGDVSIKEYLAATLVLSLGTEGERFEFYFRVFDEEEKGFLYKAEAIDLMETVLNRVFPSFEKRREYVDMLFKEMDQEKNGLIREKFFMVICMENPILRSELCPFCLPLYKVYHDLPGSRGLRSRRNAIDGGKHAHIQSFEERIRPKMHSRNCTA